MPCIPHDRYPVTPDTKGFIECNEVGELSNCARQFRADCTRQTRCETLVPVNHDETWLSPGRMMTFIRSALFVLILVGSALPCVGQSAKAQLTADDLLATADLDDKYAQDVIRRAGELDDAGNLEQRLVALGRSVHEQRNRNSNAELRALPILRLESVSKHWRFLHSQYRTWRASFDASNNEFLADGAGLARRISAWQSARQRPEIANGPEVLLTRITSVEAALAAADAALSAPLQRHITLGQHATAVLLEIEAGQRQVASAIDHSDSRLTRIDSPPLWHRDSYAQRTDPTAMDRALAVEVDFAKDYATVNSAARRATYGIALALLPFLFWLRHRVRNLQAVDPESQAAARVLRRPIASWLLLMLGVMLVVESDAPVLVHQVLLFLALVPVLRLLPTRVYQVLGPWPFIISALYLLSLGGFTITPDPVLHRWYLLGLGFLTGVSLVWFLVVRRHSGAEPATLDRSIYVLRGTGWLAATFLAVATAANIAGNVTLAEMLVSTSLLSAYLALVLFAAVHLARSILHMALGSRPATHHRLTVEYGGAVVRGVDWLLILAASATWITVTLDQLRILRPIYSVVHSVLTYPMGFGAISVSLGGILLFCFSVWLAFWVARAVRAILHDEVLPSMPLPRGVGNSIASLSYYALLIVGLSVALVAAGFQVTQLTIVLGALGVGIGLGLQSVVNNFVSGLILMFERPIQPGDAIEVAGAAGLVQDIGMRATRLRTGDGADLIVPNGMLLAEKLTNWTLSDRKRRVEVSVVVAYGSEPKQVLDLLQRAAGAVAGAAPDPAPKAMFSAMGTNGLEFTVGAWTNDFSNWGQLRSDLVIALHDALARAGLQTPFPQRDLHLRSIAPGIEAASSALSSPART